MPIDASKPDQKQLWTVGLWLAVCLAAGGGLAFQLRANSYPLLAILFGSIWLTCMVRKSHLSDMFFSQLLFGLGFYAIAFQGLLGPLNGAFGGMWFLLTISYTVIQSIVFTGFCFYCRSTRFSFFILPFAIVSWEYLRHLMTKLYDGCGLTFCQSGQALVNEFRLLQIVELGGVWMLSFLYIVLATAIAGLLVRPLPTRHRVAMMLFAVTLLASSFLFGIIRQEQLIKQTSLTNNYATFVVCPRKPTEDIVSDLTKTITQLTEKENRGEVSVLFPETCLKWQPATQSKSSEEQLLLLELSNKKECTVIVGAWVATDSSRGERNAVLFLRNAQVFCMIDKMHPAPFVERQPPGTNWMIQMGLIPRAAVHKIATASRADFHLWEEGTLPCVPSICYDLFFSETFLRYPQNIPSISVCSLDESFDGNNVFQSLSYVHTKLRAVEFRQPLVRSSLDGVSGAFDLLGSEMEPVEIIDTFAVYRIPLVHIETLYEQYGDWFAQFCTLVTLIYLAGSLVINRRKASLK